MPPSSALSDESEPAIALLLAPTAAGANNVWTSGSPKLTAPNVKLGCVCACFVMISLTAWPRSTFGSVPDIEPESSMIASTFVSGVHAAA